MRTSTKDREDTLNIDSFIPWLGKTSQSSELIETWPINGLRATLDETGDYKTGDPAPLLSQWLFFPPTVQHSKIAEDGHPVRGDFLPAIPLPRRMWAASDVKFHAPLRIGQTVTKQAAISDISLKQGSTGPLVFVKVANRYSDGSGAMLLEETQTLVYRDHPKPGEESPLGKEAPKACEWSDSIQPDEAMLFRYSAVTFNAHRIHYDRSYARDVEGYQDIIVQGQLTATLMLHALVRAKPEIKVTGFSFRGVRPIFCGETFFVEGARETETNYALWARDQDGFLRTSATATVS
jgi:3-methylfumaryl-CoA hydratase